MRTVTGIFRSRREAEATRERLIDAGFKEQAAIVLAPGEADQALSTVPAEEGEQPGMGKALGGVVGGAIGLAAGAAVSQFVLPGIGPVLAIGLGAGVLGLGGAVAGAAGGGLVENLLTRGLPKDEIFFYEDALRQKRSVLIGASEDEEQIERGREIIEQSGAESLDAAREKWWIGLRSAEETHYDAGEDSNQNESIYRRGFEAALHPELRGKSFQHAADLLRKEYGDLYDREAFRRGYEHGQGYVANLPNRAAPFSTER